MILSIGKYNFIGQNIMLIEQKKAIASLFERALSNMGVNGVSVLLERPKMADHGDLACNVAMQLARTLKKSPRDIATQLVEEIEKLSESDSLIESLEIAGPGFINMRLSAAAKTAAIVFITFICSQSSCFFLIMIPTSISNAADKR